MGKFNTSRNPQPHKRYKKNLPYKEFSQQTIEMMWRSEIWGSGNIGKERAMGILPGNYCKGASVQLGSVTQPCLTLQPHRLQHARPPCPLPTPGIYPNSSPLSHWCHPATSSSVIPFSSCPQSLPASGSFQISQLFVSGGQSTGVSASSSVLSMSAQDWRPLGWTVWISLQSKGLSGVFSNTTVQKHQFFRAQLSLQPNFHIHTWLLEKT